MKSDNKKRIFVWFGENDFEIHQTVKSWMEMFEKKHTAFNVVTIDSKDFRSKDSLLKEVKNSLQVDSLFGSHKFILLKNFFVKSVDKEVVTFLKDHLGNLSESFFVVFVQDEKPDNRLVLFRELQKMGKQGLAEIKEFALPKGIQIVKWVESRVKFHGAQIDPRAIELMVSFVGNDLWQIDTEVHKLASYKNGELITDKDVGLLVKGKFNDDIFALMDALGTKNKPVIIKLMNEQLNSGANEMYLLAMLVRQFRLLRQVKEMFEREGMRAKEDIARALRLHPFVVQKTMAQISHFKFDELEKIYGNLLDIECSMKTKSLSFKLLFDKFVVEL